MTPQPSLDLVLRTLPEPTPRKTLELLNASYDLAVETHGERRRESGESYVAHDLAVAYTVGEIGIDAITTAAALVHDTLTAPHVVDAKHNLSIMQEHLNPQVAYLVKGQEKLSPYTTLSGDEDARKLEKLRRAILHIVDDDIRILLLRMADHLQDLNVAARLPEEKRVAIAREAGEIYAPIANRLGIWSLKWQLEDGSFRHLKPEIYKDIASKISERRIERDTRIENIKARLRQRVAEVGIKARITGRPKHIVSIYKKMERKNVPFEEIYDLRAVRIILDEEDVSKCYQVLGIVHNMWRPIPEEFDDYIANPKPNGYRSLHTAVYEGGEFLEVQIRTKSMDDEAERGIAAHWAYKEGGKPTSELRRRVEWMRHLLIDLRDEEGEDTPTEMRMINVDDLSKRIYVFTPKNELIELPEGGTPIDFAYQIHTEVGHRCRGAIVNGKMVALNHKLHQGDVVEIITTKRGAPSRDWMSESSGYTASARTRSKIRQWFRVHEREDNMLRGLELIERELKRLKVDGDIKTTDISTFLKMSEEDLLARVGFGDVQFTQVTGAIGLILDKRRQADQKKEAIQAEVESAYQTPTQHSGLTIQGLSGLHYKFATCCQPIPPEPIQGYITRGRGVSIHRTDCPQFKSLARKEPGRIIDTAWGATQSSERFDIPMMVQAFRRPNLAEDIATAVSGRDIGITKTKSLRDEKGITTVYLLVKVKSLDDLEWFKLRIGRMSNVLEVKRQRS